MTFATCFILSGCDTHIDFLRLFFLVRVICPLMQEHSLWLKKLISQAPEDAMFKIRRPVFKRLFKSNYMLRAMQPKKQCKSNLSTVSVLAKRSLLQGLMHSWFHGTTVPNVCLQALTLFLPCPCNFFILAFPKQRACLQATVHLTFIATTALHVQIVTKDVLCHFAFRCQNCAEAGYRCNWCTYRGICTNDVNTECPGEFIPPIQVCGKMFCAVEALLSGLPQETGAVAGQGAKKISVTTCHLGKL